MSIATQIERLQGVRDQIRTKMVGLGLSENTDLLQDLADDLDSVNKISPTNNGTTDPGTGYTNVDTLGRSTSTRYIKIPKGYNDTNRKFTVSGVANGAYSASVASHTTTNATASSNVSGSVTDVATTTKPSGTDGTDYYTITPKLTTTAGSSKATGKATISTAGYLAAGNKSSSESSKTVGVTATQGDNYYLKAGSYSASVASHTTTNATASSNVSGSIVNITSATKPTTGYDGADYYTITPKLTTGNGSSKATGKATIGTAGYLATGDTTSAESSKTVGVTASQGDNYYLKAGSYSASVASHTTSNATAGSSVTGSITGVATTTKPSGTDGADYYTITPKLTTSAGSSKATGKATIGTSGYLAVGNTTSGESSKSVGVTASQGGDYYLKAGKSSDVTATVTASVSNITSINASQVTDGVTVTASASGSTVVPTGYYSTQVSKTPSNSASTTIKPKLAGTNGAVELTAGTSAFTKTSTADYSNGFITSVKVNPTPSEEKTVTPSNTTQTVAPAAGKLLSKVTVNAIPSPYFDTSGVTATADTVLKDYKFVNSSGTTVTGTIATATSSNVSGSVSGSNPSKITLTTASTSGSSSTTATASATVTRGLYTGSSDITKSLTSKTITATAEATLAASVSGSTTVPSTLPAGTVTITPNTDNTKRIYSDSKNKGFMTGVVLEAMPTGAYSASVASHTTTNATASSSVTGSITNVASTTKPSGTDGTSYYTITPKLTTGAGSSKATGKATVDTAGYLAAGNKSSSESSKSVGVTASQGSDYYLKAGSYSASVSSHTTSNATAGSSVTGTVTNIATTTKPAGTDGTDYYTITPKLTTSAGSSKATGKATVDTAGYLATGNTTSTESSKSVGVTASQGDSYYLKASSVTKEDPGTSYANKATVTPSTSAQYVKVTAGYLPNSKITVEAIPNQKGKDDVTATVTADVSNITSINASQVTDGVTVTASASGSTVVPVGYYSAQVSKTPSNSKSTTIKPKLAGTNGAIELTAGTSAFTKTSTADYSNGFITSVKVNPTPSSAKEFTPTIAGGTVSPDTGKLLSSVTVKGVPSFSVTLFSDSWSSDNNAAIGKYYYNVDNTRITADNNLYVAPISASASQSQSFGVYAYSQSKASGASSGTLQFRAMIQPTSNLTYTIYCLS